MKKYWCLRRKLKFQYVKVICILSALAIAIGCLPFAVAAESEPCIEQNANAADFMTVMNNGINVTDIFKSTGEINVLANTRGEFTNTYFNGDEYYFSADINIGSDSSSYGSIRMVLGYCTFEGDRKYIELCVRPNIGGQTVYFLNGSNEYAVKVGTSYPIEIGKTYRYTAKYKNGKVSYWADGVLIFDNVSLPSEAANVNLCPGFYSQNCNGTISNISIWGDVEEIKCPVFDSENDANLIQKVLVNNNSTGETYKPADFEIKSAIDSTVRTTFCGINYSANTYKISTNALMSDNPNADYEGLIFKAATAVKQGMNWDIEIRMRSNCLVLFNINNSGEQVIEIKNTEKTEFSSKDWYTVFYRSDNTIDLWKNGSAIYYRLDLTKFGFTDIKPELSLGGEVCNYEFSDIKLWGEGLIIDSEPEFNPENDKNLMPYTIISNPISGEAKKCRECSIDNDKPDTCRLKILAPQYNGKYTFSAKGTIKDNQNIAPWGQVYDFEGLILSVGKSSKDGNEATIEVRLRNSGVFIFAFRNNGEDVIYENYSYKTAFDKEYSYTVDFKEDGTFDVWINGICAIRSFDITEKGYEKITPELNIGGEVCEFKFSDMKLWGNIFVPIPPAFDSAKSDDLINKVVVNDVFSGKLYKLNNGNISNKTMQSGRVDFSGIELKGDYTFFADAAFEDNKNITDSGNEYNWEGIIFRAQSAKKDSTDYLIEIRVRSNNLLVYSVKENGEETLIYNKGIATPYGQNSSYVLDSKNGKLDLWQNEVLILTAFDASEYGFSDLTPILGIGGEVCNFTFENMHLVSKGAGFSPDVPKMPKSNGDYSEVTEIDINGVISFDKGELKCKDDSEPYKAFFKYLPFTANDTYLFGADVKVLKAKENWMGTRFIIGVNKKGENIVLLFTDYSLLVAEGEKILYSLPFKRELNKNYRFDILVKSESVSVWVNDILLINNIATPEKKEAKTGVLFEYCAAELKNINLYHTSPAKFIKPSKPAKAVLKRLSENQYNAAEYAKVTLDEKDYDGYFNCKLLSNTSTQGLRYMFSNLPVKDDSEYYFSSKFKVNESSEVWKGPRYILRGNNETTLYCAVSQTGILILANGEQLASSPFKLQIGKEYDIVILSSPENISVWLDGELIFENIDLSGLNDSGKLKVKSGILFELCQAVVSNIAIYGKDIIFNPDYVDMELYNDRFYNMACVPAKAPNAENLFTGITMYDTSAGSLGASYVDSARVFKNDYDDVENGKVVFVDAAGSSNLNGLKNESGYVFNFNYTVNSKSGESDQNGIWFVCNNSLAPWLETACNIMVGILNNSVELRVYKDGILVSEQKNEFKCLINKNYKVSVVHGSDWIKLYIDNELVLVSTKLPKYKLSFDFIINKTACTAKDFELYEMVDTGLSIYEKASTETQKKAGNTIRNAQGFDIDPNIHFPIVITVVLSALALTSAAVGVYFIIKKRNFGKK